MSYFHRQTLALKGSTGCPKTFCVLARQKPDETDLTVLKLARPKRFHQSKFKLS
jgi:hypothetical protein